MAAKKINLHSYLGTVSITPQDAWVVKKMLFREAEEERTESDWKKVISQKCQGVKFKK